MNFYNKHLINDFCLKKYEILFLFELFKKNICIKKYNKNICIINEKFSLRTINSLINSLLNKNIKFSIINNIHNIKKESIKDFSRTIGLSYDYIFYRGNNEDFIKLIAKFSGSVIYNLLTNNFHPFQSISDIYCIKNSLYFIGNSNTNVCKSLIIILSKLNQLIVIMSIKTNWDKIFLKKIFTKKKLIFTEKILLSKYISSIYTDVWISMGENKFKKVNIFKKYKINLKLLKKINFLNILHCLPSCKNFEIEEEIFESNFYKFDNQIKLKFKIFNCLIILNESFFFNFFNFINFIIINNFF